MQCAHLHGVLIGTDAVPVFLLVVQLTALLQALIELQPIERHRFGRALHVRLMMLLAAGGRLRCNGTAVAIQRAQLHHVVDQTDQRFTLLVLLLQFDQLALQLLESRQVFSASVAITRSNAVLRQ